MTAELGYSCFMATLTIRNLDETVKRRLQVRAALNGLSMEAEARAILTAYVEDAPRTPAPDENLVSSF
jgi:plasmid stability protein